MSRCHYALASSAGMPCRILDLPSTISCGNSSSRKATSQEIGTNFLSTLRRRISIAANKERDPAACHIRWDDGVALEVQRYQPRARDWRIQPSGPYTNIVSRAVDVLRSP